MENICPHLTAVIIEKSAGEICIATKEQYQPDYSLFYIPVKPVFRLLRSTATQKSANLFLSLFAWLHLHVAIECYGEKTSYVATLYDSIRDSMEMCADEYPELEYHTAMTHFKIVTAGGQLIQRKIADKKHMHHWADRIATYKPGNDWELELLETAQQAYQLYQSFPLRNLCDNFGQCDMNLEEYDALFEPWQYTGFLWSYDCWSSKQLIEWINSENEGALTLYPVAYQLFDTPQATIADDLAFEKKLFPLMEQITYLLTIAP